MAQGGLDNLYKSTILIFLVFTEFLEFLCFLVVLSGGPMSVVKHPYASKKKLAVKVNRS